MADFPPLDRSQKIVDQGIMSPRMLLWEEAVTRLAIAEGEGSPEGVLEARPTKLYMDTDNGDLYIKHLTDIGNDRKLGWVVV
jgi:hypothetical protein